MEQLNLLLDALMPTIISIVTAIAGYVAVVIKNKIAEKVDTETKKEVVEATVKYVQQVYETLDGPEKLQKALETTLQWLSEKGIIISETEATILIEAAIKGLKQGWTTNKALPEVETTEATETK